VPELGGWLSPLPLDEPSLKPEPPPSEVVDVSPLPELVVWVPPSAEREPEPLPSEVVDVSPLPELVGPVLPPSDPEPSSDPEPEP
jgi:hypothetical protein